MRAVLAAAMRRLAERLAPSVPLTLHIECEAAAIDTEAVIRAIQRRNRRKGLGSAGI